MPGAVSDLTWRLPYLRHVLSGFHQAGLSCFRALSALLPGAAGERLASHFPTVYPKAKLLLGTADAGSPREAGEALLSGRVCRRFGNCVFRQRGQLFPFKRRLFLSWWWKIQVRLFECPEEMSQIKSHTAIPRSFGGHRQQGGACPLPQEAPAMRMDQPMIQPKLWLPLMVGQVCPCRPGPNTESRALS